MAQETYQQLSLTANTPFVWPNSYGGGLAIQDQNDVSADMGPWSFIMPDATQAIPGAFFKFNNVSSNTFNIKANDGSTLITAVDPGQLIQIYLIGNFTANGYWRVVPYGSGTNAIVSYSSTSVDNSIVITNPNITPPGGTTNFALPTSLSNFNQITDKGILVVTSTGPLTFDQVTFATDSNINIVNPDGVAGNPTFSLNSALTNITSIAVGNMTLTGNTIAPITSNSDLILESNGTGTLSLNGVIIDGSGNVTINGTFNNPLIPKASIVFTDTLVGLTNDITIVNKSNSSATLSWLSAGTYKYTFGITLPTTNYGLQITTGSDGGTLPFVSQGSYITSTMTKTDVTLQITDRSGTPVTSLPYGATVQVIQS